MRKYFLAILTPALCSTLFAEPIGSETAFRDKRTEPAPVCCPKKVDPCARDNSRIQVGGTYSYVHIKPEDNPSTHGHLGGMQALYEYRAPNRIYGGLEFAWKQGITKGAGVSRFLLDFDVQERIGYTFSWSDDDFRCSLFTGFGYRHLGQNVKSNGSTVRFNYNELYVPVGFLWDWRISSTVFLGLNFQWMPQALPTVTIIPIDGARWKLTYRLDNFLVELPITVVVSEEYHLSMLFIPFFESWHDGHTTAVTESGIPLDVPGNAYLFGGISVNLGYSF